MLPVRRYVAWAVVCGSLAIVGRGVAQDGLRPVDVRRYGIQVRVPQAWTPIDWGTNEKAFVLRVPQDDRSPAGAGLVSCELGVAPGSLEEFRQRLQEGDDAEQKRDEPRCKLTENRLEKLAAGKFGKQNAEQLGQRLISVWEHKDRKGTWFEQRVQLVSHDTLYTFSLTSDEAHYDAYRADFEEMLQAAKFTAPETGLQRLPGDFWLQRDYRFALQLPKLWQPSFVPHDKVLFFAASASHGVSSDNLFVLASPAQPLELAELKHSYAAAIKAENPQAEIDCKLVPQGNGVALETVIHTRRGPLDLTIIERRFQGQNRNYEVKFTCQTKEFRLLEVELRKCLDSFRELPAAENKTVF